MGEIIENEYGKIEILERISHKKIKFKCFCGKIHITSNITKLREKITKSCGCLKSTTPCGRNIKKEENNLFNKKFGLLTVVEHLGKWKWRCKCACGKEIITDTKFLKADKKCCGCSRTKPYNENHKYHCKIHNRWLGILDRNIISEEFKDFNKFKEYIYNDLKLNDNCEKYEISRIDINKKMERGNIHIKIITHEKDFYGTKYRWCTRCKKYVSISERFWQNAKVKEYCKECKFLYGLKYRIGMEKDEYYELRKNIKECEICKNSISFSRSNRTACIDHCHKTNKFRGVLCTNCNSGLGAFGDNTEYLKNAIKYLNKGDTEHIYTPWNKNKRNKKINNICLITGLTEKLVCDHNHNTGYIRGNINSKINLGLGLFKDLVKNLENAIIYLEKERN